MLGGLWHRLGFAPAASEESLDDLARFCAVLTGQFADRLPPQFERSLATVAAWWAIALYVQFPNFVGARRFKQPEWQAASRLVADLMMARMFPDMPEDGPEKANLRDALQGQVFGVCKLWIAAFGFPPEPEKLQDTQHITDQLIALFGNERLGLRQQFDLPADDDADDDEDYEAEKEEADDSDMEDPVIELCRAFAVFFDICERSRP